MQMLWGWSYSCLANTKVDTIVGRHVVNNIINSSYSRKQRPPSLKGVMYENEIKESYNGNGEQGCVDNTYPKNEGRCAKTVLYRELSAPRHRMQRGLRRTESLC